MAQRIRLTFTLKLKCPICGRKHQVKLTNVHRTVYCPCGRMQWRI